jgi:hypothetical protein
VAMNAHNSDITEGSLLHRALRITPGYAPVWFCSRNTCAGFDLLTAIATGAIGCMIFLPTRIGWWTWWLGVPIVIACLVFGIPFQDRERWGRARRRRGECVWCGQKDTSPDVPCRKCDRIAIERVAWGGPGS